MVSCGDKAASDDDEEVEGILEKILNLIFTDNCQLA